MKAEILAKYLKYYWYLFFRPIFFRTLIVLGLAGSFSSCSKSGKDFSQQSTSSTSGDDSSVATIIFSGTLGGAGQQSFGTSATIYGRVQKSGLGASSCLEKFGSNDGFCQSPSNYTSMPNADWQFDSSVNEWKATFSPGVFTEGTYKVYWKNANSNKRGFVSLQVLDANKPQMVIVEYPYNKPETTYQQFEAIYFLVANAPQTGSQFCREIVGSEDGVCLSGNNWADPLNHNFRYSSTLQQWEALVKAGEAQLGSYRFFWRNSTTKAVSTPVMITVTADTGPILVFSKDPFGSGSTTFKTTDDFYGYVINGDPNNSLSCLENLAVDAGKCSNASNFTSMPNADWKFSSTNQRWEVRLGPSSTQLSTETVNLKAFWRNGSTGKSGIGVDLKLVK